MARVLKLVRGATSLGLLERPGFCLAEDDWKPGEAEPVAGEIPPYIEEVLPLRLVGTSHDDMATRLQALHVMQQGAARYASDRTETTPVWLHVKLDNETEERRALVRSLPGRFGEGWYGEEAKNLTLARAQVVERHPYWEPLTPSVAGTGAGLSCMGDGFDYTVAPAADITGDVPARIANLILDASSGSNLLWRAWFGFRSALKHGTLNNFMPNWECEKGAPGTDTALAADATASPGGPGNNKMQCTFATVTDWRQRVMLLLSDVTANYGDQYGRCLVILRARADAGCVAQVKLSSGYANSLVYKDPVAVNAHNSFYYLHPLGIVNIPPRNLRSIPTSILAAVTDKSMQINIDARRVSGAGSLHLDCLLMVPVDEYMLHFSALAIGGTAMYTARLGNSPDDISECLVYGAVPGTQYRAPDQAYGEGVPIGDGRMYGVYAREYDISGLDDTWDASLNVYPRWSSLRGSE